MNTSNKEKNFISAVIYVYNNEANMYSLLENIDRSLNSNFDKYEIICVNDASDDNSTGEIKRYSESSSCTISILHMSYHQGLELSMNAGVDLAIGDFVYEFDSPVLPFTSDSIMEIYFKALEGYDIVAAAPERPQNIFSRFFYSVYNKYSHSQYALRSETFRIVSRRALNRVKAMAKLILYRKAMYANCGLKKYTISYSVLSNTSNKNHLKNRDYRDTAIDSLILYTDLAYRWSMIFSLLMMGAMTIFAIYTMVIYSQGRPIAGWSSTILFLTFAFFGVFAISTTIIKYLSLVLRLNFNKMNYVIESIEKVK